MYNFVFVSCGLFVTMFQFSRSVFKKKIIFFKLLKVKSKCQERGNLELGVVQVGEGIWGEETNIYSLKQSASKPFDICWGCIVSMDLLRMQCWFLLRIIKYKCLFVSVHAFPFVKLPSHILCSFSLQYWLTHILLFQHLWLQYCILCGLSSFTYTNPAVCV